MDGGASPNRALARRLQEGAFFYDHVLGARMWPFQLGISDAVDKHEHVCVQSCHASGKDFTVARIAVRFMLKYPPFRSSTKVITTGPTDRQVREILWNEIAVAHRDARVDLGGRLIQQKWELDRDWFALGFTASDYDPSAAQGWHAHHLMFILDEATGVSREIREAIAGNLSAGIVTRQVEIGNPTDPQSPFAAECRSSQTYTIKISAFDTPNFTDLGLTRDNFREDDIEAWRSEVPDSWSPPAPYLIQPHWVAKQVARYGWEDDFVVSRVLGEFPSGGPLSLLNREWIVKAQEASLPESGLVVLTCDVARFGDDHTVIGLRRGSRYRKLDKFRGYPTDVTEEALVEAAKIHNVDQVRIDDDGVGGGVTDHCKRELEPKGVTVVAMNAASTALEIEHEDDEFRRFGNAKTEWHWNFRNLMRRGEVDLDPREDELAEELSQLRKRESYDARGRMMVEDKKAYKKRVGRSPDEADACIMAFAPVEAFPRVQVF